MRLSFSLSISLDYCRGNFFCLFALGHIVSLVLAYFSSSYVDELTVEKGYVGESLQDGRPKDSRGYLKEENKDAIIKFYSSSYSQSIYKITSHVNTML